MKTWMRVAMMATVIVVAPACADVAVDEAVETDDVETVDQAATSCDFLIVANYGYSDATGSYRWDVTYNFTRGTTYVDERRIGGGFYRQYRVIPDWSISPPSPEIITLTSGTLRLTGQHNSLPGGREEVHLEKQRVLSRETPFYTQPACN